MAMAPSLPRRVAQCDPAAVPPLNSGDRLSRAEFHRRYLLHPEIEFAELVEGVVYVPSPAHHRSHGNSSFIVQGWLVRYLENRAGIEGGNQSSTFLDGDNEVRPDALLRYTDAPNRRSEITEDDYLTGAPELVVEIAASSASYDLGDKLRAYRRNGVQEYIVWTTYENELYWFSLEDGEYLRLLPDDRGVIHSKVFPGLRLAVDRLLARDLDGVLAEQKRKARGPRKPSAKG
ncbi:hypothetical protein AYO38_00180 [bacterium SCGC AG-212-C10]|nr:hypothetical protein AYO38_00180 [bacterium SCGC AG-212-C10]